MTDSQTAGSATHLDIPAGTTLLALVQTLTRHGADESQVVEQAIELLESGRTRLIGNFRNVPLDAFLGDLATAA